MPLKDVLKAFLIENPQQTEKQMQQVRKQRFQHKTQIVWDRLKNYPVYSLMDFEVRTVGGKIQQYYDSEYL